MTDAQLAMLYELLKQFAEAYLEDLGSLDLAALDISRTIVDELRSTEARRRVK